MGSHAVCWDIKATLASVWTTKNITFTVEPESFDGDAYCSNKSHIGAWSGYCGARFVNGNLDIFTKKDRFYPNIDGVYQQMYTKILANATKTGDLSLELRLELIKSADEIKECCERIAKAIGVDTIKWDIEADAKAILARGDLEYTFDFYLALLYMNGLASTLEFQLTEALLKEAVADAVSAKTVSLKIYDSLVRLKGLETHTPYNGIQFVDGGIVVFTPLNNWAHNADDVAHTHKLISLF